MTDEIDGAQPQDATAESDVPSGIVRLGIEARAEYVRARKRLGLSGEAAEQLGIVGRYRLEAELGRGGMGIVYRASDPELDRPVAIKLVQAVPFVRYDKLRARLLREAKVLAKLTDPNVVRVYDCGQHEGEVYLAMEYVEGATLREWERGRSRHSILDAYQQAARGLAAAHDMGIIHRDFKPDNVLVASDGRVLVGDFGLAGVLAEDELRTDGLPTDAPTTGERVSATRTGALLGTLAYMAPEQLRGEVATPRSDQFAFCVSLWEALTGARPFEGEQGEELLGEIEQGRIRGAERLPRRLRARLLRGLAIDPEARFDDLRELAGGLLPRRGRVVLGIGLSLSLVVGLVIGLLLEQAHRPCEDLRARIDEVNTMPQWLQVQASLDDPTLRPTYERLRRQPRSMLMETEDLCRLGTDDQGVARRKWLEGRVGDLAGTLLTSAVDDPARLQYAADYLEAERWNAPPLRPLDPEVDELLKRSYSSRMNNELENALALAEQAVNVAGNRDLELALAHRWRGRVLAFMDGRHEDAMDAYQAAVRHADAASYDGVRLEAELLAARTAVMRLGDLGRARDSLSRADGLLDRLGEPWLSPRRADYYEVLAAVRKREGQYEDALGDQWLALFMRGWRGDVLQIGVGYLNLGTIHERRGHGSDLDLARRYYGQALEFLEPLSPTPEWLEATFGLGHWLMLYGEENELPRALDLLQVAGDGSGEIRPSALTDLTLLAVELGDTANARKWSQELETMLLRDSSKDRSSLSLERRLDGWLSITLAHAMLEDLSAFERAYACVDREARSVHRDGTSAQVDLVERKTVQLDLTAAQILAELAPDRSRELAVSVRDYVQRQPEETREKQPELQEMLAAAEDLIP